MGGGGDFFDFLMLAHASPTNRMGFDCAFSTSLMRLPFETAPDDDDVAPASGLVELIFNEISVEGQQP